MPAASFLIIPALTISRWLTTSASAGASLRVETKKLEARIATCLRARARKPGHIMAADDKASGVRMLDKEGYRPKGGIKHGESPEQAMYRELYEEIGLRSEHVRIVARTRDWLRYDVPERWM